MKRKNYFKDIVIVFVLLAAIASVAVVTNKPPLSKEDFFEQSKKDEHNVLKKTIVSIGANLISVFEKEVIMIDVPFKKQENRLTCEVSALRMALNFLGNNVTEEELIGGLSFSSPALRTAENVWGDPEEGFVGDVNGSVHFGTGYGVYAAPISKLADQYADAEVMESPNLEDILEEVEDGNPVIAWGIISNRNFMFWYSEQERIISAYPGEHARVVIGYVGNRKSPYKIILMDPLYGKISLPTQRFIDDWALFNNMAVVIKRNT